MKVTYSWLREYAQLRIALREELDRAVATKRLHYLSIRSIFDGDMCSMALRWMSRARSCSREPERFSPGEARVKASQALANLGVARHGRRRKSREQRTSVLSVPCRSALFHEPTVTDHQRLARQRVGPVIASSVVGAAHQHQLLDVRVYGPVDRALLGVEST